jgi:alkanesulfonate monooxygenase SsuD/methylene tetrahydromethanopterin reductase-like flavin-dependent oxidoreductase (luciferase family)
MEFGHFSHCWHKYGMSTGQRYELLWRELALADRSGFDYGFSVEHHFNPIESLMSQPAIYCMGAGLNTHRLRLGPMGFVVPLHHPIRLLEQITTLDQATAGRLIIGLVSGIVPSLLTTWGVDFELRRDVTLEALDLIRTAFETPDGEPFSFKGEFFEIQNVRLAVPPLQRPHPPIWLQSRDPRTLQVLAQRGIDTGYFYFFPRDEAARRYPDYLHRWRTQGWPRRPRISYLTLVYVDETDQRARERAMPNALEALRKFLANGGNPEAAQANMNNIARLFEQRGEPGGAQIIRNLQNPEYLLGNNLYFIGAPDTVAAQIKTAAREGLFNVLLCEFNFGSLAEDDVMRSIKLFASEVIPDLRDFEPL